MQSNFVPAASVSADGAPADPPPGYLTRLAAAFKVERIDSAPDVATPLHPCFIDGVRTLIFKRGLGSEHPSLYRRLCNFARENGFQLKEERRKRQLECRDERRRLAPVLMFAAGLLASVAQAEDGTLTQQGQTVMPTIEIIGQRAAPDRREYLNVAGKRFVSQPYGEVELIMAVADSVRRQGELRRVRTRGLQMPSEYTDSFIDRYDYTMPDQCGGQSFSFYEGDNFAALGYHDGTGKVVLDVLVGGSPFSAPRLWGAYDQVLNSNVRMKLMFGDGLKDGMGILMASYKIGLMPVMRSDTKNYYGELYSRAISAASACEIPGIPQVRHAQVVDSAADEAG